MFGWSDNTAEFCILKNTFKKTACELGATVKQTFETIDVDGIFQHKI